MYYIKVNKFVKLAKFGLLEYFCVLYFIKVTMFFKLANICILRRLKDRTGSWCKYYLNNFSAPLWKQSMMPTQIGLWASHLSWGVQEAVVLEMRMTQWKT